MKEATTRRYTRLLNEKAELPDLIMIDGGIGQVNAVKEVLDALDLDIPLVGLAEKNEELYRPGNSTPMVLPRRSDALRLLQRVRDETHRFATTQNQKLRSKENIVSRFEKLPNIGKKRAKLIYKTWKTLSVFAEICKSNPEEVSETLAMSLSKVEEARLGAEILLKEAAEKQETAKAAGVTGMVRPHREKSLFSEMAGAALQGGGFHSGGAGLPEMASTEKKVQSPQNASFGTDEVSSENSYLSSLATTALDAPLEAAEPEPEYQ
jgi:excinuclease ABC subunit C